VLVVLDALEVVGVEGSDPFAVGDGAYFRIVIADVLLDADASKRDLVEFLKVRVVVVHEAPKLQVNKGHPLEPLKDLFFFLLGQNLAH
jgi:hypothetical protein